MRNRKVPITPSRERHHGGEKGTPPSTLMVEYCAILQRRHSDPTSRKERAFFDPGLNSNTGNNSSEKRLAPTVSPKSNRPQIFVRRLRLLKSFSTWRQARKSNNSKPRGRGVALHECCLAPSPLEPPNITPQFRLYGDQGQRLSLWDTSFRSGQRYKRRMTRGPKPHVTFQWITQ